MKYLKLFEMVSEYSEITINEFYDKNENENIELFTSFEVSTISSIMPGYIVEEHEDLSVYALNKSMWPEFYSINIFKTEDEWYYIKVPPIKMPIANHLDWCYYRCDQFDGLLKCIKDILNEVSKTI